MTISNSFFSPQQKPHLFKDINTGLWEVSITNNCHADLVAKAIHWVKRRNQLSSAINTLTKLKAKVL